MDQIAASSTPIVLSEGDSFGYASEWLARHMDSAAISTVFPGFSVNSKEFLGVLKA